MEKGPLKTNFPVVVAKGDHKQALKYFAVAHASSLRLHYFALPFIIKSCAKLRTLLGTQQVHAHLIKLGFVEGSHTATALTDAYMKLHHFQDALKMFEGMPEPKLPLLNAIISGFSQAKHFQDALDAIKRLRELCLLPSSETIAGALPACETVEQGSQMHNISMKMGLISDVYVATALVTMYSNCREILCARMLFDCIRFKTVVSYNSMILGYLRNGQPSMSLDVLQLMFTDHKSWPSSSTFVTLLSVSLELTNLMLGKQIHCQILRRQSGFNVVTGTALIEMYSKCLSLKCAKQVFKSMRGDRNLVTWNTMLSALLSHNCVDQAIRLLEQFGKQGLIPDSVTWNLIISGLSQLGRPFLALEFFKQMQLVNGAAANSSLKILTSFLLACSQLSDVRRGKEIHCHALRIVRDYKDEMFQVSLIHTYMRSGCSLLARKVFYEMDNRNCDTTLWNTMIDGHGRNGEHRLALEIFRIMKKNGAEPDSTTFLCALSACRHTGQIDAGCEIFRAMVEDHCVDPTEEQFGCMVDLLGRAGRLTEALDLLQRIHEPSSSLYASLLGACSSFDAVDLGEMVAQRLVEMDPGSPTPLAMLSNIYAARGRWIDVEDLRKKMADQGLTKAPGSSRILDNTSRKAGV